MQYYFANCTEYISIKKLKLHESLHESNTNWLNFSENSGIVRQADSSVNRGPFEYRQLDEAKREWTQLSEKARRGSIHEHDNCCKNQNRSYIHMNKRILSVKNPGVKQN